jgi:hypothetical protein
VTDEQHDEALPDGVLEKLRQVSTSTLATQLFRCGFRQPVLADVKPLSTVTDGFVGEASRCASSRPAKTWIPLTRTAAEGS